jgi:hypothetical protein
MALTGTFNIPTKIVNGKETLIYLGSWAAYTLTPDQFTAYLAAQARQDAIQQAAIDSGIMVITNIDADGNPVADGENKVIFGKTVSFVGEPLVNDAEYDTFLAQYRADPTLTWKESDGLIDAS